MVSSLVSLELCVQGSPSWDVGFLGGLERSRFGFREKALMSRYWRCRLI